MTANSENLLISSFIKNLELHLKKFNKILTKNYSLEIQERKLKKLYSIIKVDIKQYEKGFNSKQKEKCVNQYNDFIELRSNIKKRCKILEKEIIKNEYKEYDPYPYSEEEYDPQELKKEIMDYLGIKPVQITIPALKNKKDYYSFFNNLTDIKAFLNDLKDNLKTEKGIKIRAIIEVLKKEDVLIIGHREFKNFYQLLKNHLDRNIGSYQSINDVKNYGDEITIASEKLTPLISKYKKSNI